MQKRTFPAPVFPATTRNTPYRSMWRKWGRRVEPISEPYERRRKINLSARRTCHRLRRQAVDDSSGSSQSAKEHDMETSVTTRRHFLSTGVATGMWAGLPGLVLARETPERGGHVRLALGNGSLADTLDPARGAHSTDFTATCKHWCTKVPAPSSRYLTPSWTALPNTFGVISPTLPA